MSSHREAPSISQDPVADNTDTYAFVSPDEPDDGHDHHQLRAARGPARRAELLRVRRRRPLLDLHRQRRRRAAGDHVPVQVQDEAPEPGHVPLQHRADQRRSTARTGTSASSTPSRSSTRTARAITERGRGQGQAARQQPRVPAVQHRAALDAELRRRSRRRPFTRLARRRDGVRGPAQRRLLRRPRRRSSTSATSGQLQNLHLIVIPPPTGIERRPAKTLNVHTIAIQVPIKTLTRTARSRPTR